MRLGLLWTVILIGLAGLPFLPGCNDNQEASLPDATGFFQVAEVDGRWLLITPDGRPFYSVGVNHVTANNNTDRETGVCPYCVAVDSTYESREAWAETTSERLASWGFNTIGAWSDDQLFAPLMPYTELLNYGGGQSDYFSKEFMERVQEITADKVVPLKDDPKHLILGARASSLSMPPQVPQAATPYLDVFSVNFYATVEGLFDTLNGQWGPLVPIENWLETYYELSGLPLMATEFSFRSSESDLPNTEPPIYLTFDTQVERAAAYDEYVQSCFDAPYIVGQHWFEYVDQPIGGRFDGENNNFGLVTVEDEPYDDFVEPVTVTNARAPHLTD